MESDNAAKWAYTPGECDGDGCAGDCDLCLKSIGHPGRESRKKQLALSVGVCPYCMKNLADRSDSNGKLSQYCYSCHFCFEGGAQA